MKDQEELMKDDGKAMNLNNNHAHFLLLVSLTH